MGTGYVVLSLGKLGLFYFLFIADLLHRIISVKSIYDTLEVLLALKFFLHLSELLLLVLFSFDHGQPIPLPVKPLFEGVAELLAFVLTLIRLFFLSLGFDVLEKRALLTDFPLLFLSVNLSDLWSLGLFSHLPTSVHLGLDIGMLIPALSTALGGFHLVFGSAQLSEICSRQNWFG